MESSFQLLFPLLLDIIQALELGQEKNFVVAYFEIWFADLEWKPNFRTSLNRNAVQVFRPST